MLGGGPTRMLQAPAGVDQPGHALGLLDPRGKKGGAEGETGRPWPAL